MRRIALLMTTLFAAAAACGGASTLDGQPDEYAGSGGSTSTTSSSQGGSGAAGANGGSGGMPGYLRCPDTLPANSEPCDIQDLWCTYGDDPRPNCREQAFCAAGYWYSVDPQCGPQSCTTPPSQGNTCTTEGDVCAWEGGPICVCSSCFGGPCGPPPPIWQCSASGMGCPDLMPNAGTGCSQPGAYCSYGDPCAQGFALQCDMGEWTIVEEICPL